MVWFLFPFALDILALLRCGLFPSVSPGGMYAYTAIARSPKPRVMSSKELYDSLQNWHQRSLKLLMHAGEIDFWVGKMLDPFTPYTFILLYILHNIYVVSDVVLKQCARKRDKVVLIVYDLRKLNKN